MKVLDNIRALETLDQDTMNRILTVSDYVQRSELKRQTASWRINKGYEGIERVQIHPENPILLQASKGSRSLVREINKAKKENRWACLALFPKGFDFNAPVQKGRRRIEKPIPKKILPYAEKCKKMGLKLTKLTEIYEIYKGKKKIYTTRNQGELIEEIEARFKVWSTAKQSKDARN